MRKTFASILILGFLLNGLTSCNNESEPSITSNDEWAGLSEAIKLKGESVRQESVTKLVNGNTQTAIDETPVISERWKKWLGVFLADAIGAVYGYQYGTAGSVILGVRASINACISMNNSTDTNSDLRSFSAVSDSIIVYMKSDYPEIDTLGNSHNAIIAKLCSSGISFTDENNDEILTLTKKYAKELGFDTENIVLQDLQSNIEELATVSSRTDYSIEEQISCYKKILPKESNCIDLISTYTKEAAKIKDLQSLGNYYSFTDSLVMNSKLQETDKIMVSSGISVATTSRICWTEAK